MGMGRRCVRCKSVILLVPAREGASGKERLGGPFAEVDGKRYAVAIVAGEDQYIFAARMAAKDGTHFFREKNRAAPAVGNAHTLQGRVQMTDAGFEPPEAGGGFAFANVEAVQIGRSVPV